MLMLASRNVACFPRPRLQNSPYFCVFKYAQTKSLELGSDAKNTLRGRVRRTWGSYATLTPHQIDFEKEKNNNNDKTTVLQSASGQEPGGSHALFLRIVARGYLKIRYVPDPTFELCACLITTLCVYIAPRKISFDSKPDDSKQTLWILRFERMNRRWPIRTMICGYLHLYQVKYIDGKLPAWNCLP